MTGCYPRRVNLHVSGRGGAVLQPVDRKGLHPAEVTVARMLQTAGYATACVGKWHLGDQPPFLPTRHGFDSFLGVPYSEDMTPGPGRPGWPDLPLMRDETVVEAPVDRDYLTRRYTEEAIRCITVNRERPFFLYLPHAMPGSTDTPFASPAFQGVSRNGRYGDSIEELDGSTGEIMAALQRLGLDERTLVVWTSDNGAVFRDPPQGSNAPLRGWGYDTSEGSQRMPCLVRWPGRLPAGAVCAEVLTMMDWLPTLAGLTAAALPAGRTLDGHDILPLLQGCPGAISPYDERGFYYYFMDQLQAVRSGPWKLYLPLARKRCDLGGRFAESPGMLFDVRHDLGEEREVSAGHPEVVRRLLALAETAREELGDLDREGRGQRPAGWVELATPRRLPG
jgi:arylsulfatase A-like enzyme